VRKFGFEATAGREGRREGTYQDKGLRKNATLVPIVVARRTQIALLSPRNTGTPEAALSPA